MALYSVASGATILAADLNQYYNLFTGVDTSTVPLIGAQLVVDNANNNNGSKDILFGGTGSGEGVGSKRTAGGNQNGLDFYTSSTVRLSISNAGVVTVAGSLVAHNSYYVVEGYDASHQLHVEVYPAQGSDSVGSGSYVTKTLTFVRAYTASPAIAGSCQNTGADGGNVTSKCNGISTTSGTLNFKNTDPVTQTMSNYQIIAAGY